MASVAVYSTRNRANERVGRMRRDLDRSSGYTLSNLVKQISFLEITNQAVSFYQYNNNEYFLNSSQVNNKFNDTIIQ